MMRADLVGRVVVPAMQQQGDRAGMGKLGLAAESAVHPDRSTEAIWRDRVVEQRRRDLARRGFVEVRVEDPPDGVGLGLHLIPAGAVGIEHAGQHGAEAGAAVLPIGREVGSAEEHLAGRA